VGPQNTCQTLNKFSVLDESAESKVFTAADQWLKSCGIGEIVLNVKINKRSTNRVKLTNAIYVSKLKNNLILVSQITKSGFKVIFDKDRAIVKRSDGTTAMVVEKRNKLYVMDIIEDRALQASVNPGNLKR
jgi:hypothetical protein